MKKANPATFEVLKDYYARDDKHVYFVNRTEKAHRASRDLFQVQGEKAADRGRANPIYGGARLSERRDERQDRPASKSMESGVCPR